MQEKIKNACQWLGSPEELQKWLISLYPQYVSESVSYLKRWTLEAIKLYALKEGYEYYTLWFFLAQEVRNNTHSCFDLSAYFKIFFHNGEIVFLYFGLEKFPKLCDTIHANLNVISGKIDESYFETLSEEYSHLDSIAFTYQLANHESLGEIAKKIEIAE